MTEFEGDAITLHEVKKNPRHSSSRQIRRLEEVAKAVNEQLVLPTPLGPLQLWTVRVQLRTRIATDLARAIDAAQAHRVAIERAGKGWAIHCISEGDWSEPNRTTEEVVEQLMNQSAATIAKVMGSANRIQMLSADQAGRARNLAPFTIYPLPPVTCAKLTCDYLVFQSIISTDRIVEALELEGFHHVEMVDAAETVIDGDQKVFRAICGNRVVEIHSTTIQHMLLEFVDPRLYAKALREAAVFRAEADVPQSISFSNERAVWK